MLFRSAQEKYFRAAGDHALSEFFPSKHVFSTHVTQGER